MPLFNYAGGGGGVFCQSSWHLHFQELLLRIVIEIFGPVCVNQQACVNINPIRDALAGCHFHLYYK